MSDLTTHAENTCIYCGEEIDDWSVCSCQGHVQALREDLKQIISLDGYEPEPNDRLGADEAMKLREAVFKEFGASQLDLMYSGYKLGLIRGKRSLQRRSAAGEGRCVL